MSRAIWLCLFSLSTFLAVTPVTAEDSLDQARRVREHMKEAMADMDREMAELELSRQAEFRLLVKRDLSTFEMEMESAGMDSLTVARNLGIAKKYTDPLVVDTRADANQKARQFRDFMYGARIHLGLIEPPVDTEAKLRQVRNGVFQAVVENELAKFHKELGSSGVDSARASRIMARLQSYVDSAIIAEDMDLGLKREALVGFLSDARQLFGLADTVDAETVSVNATMIMPSQLRHEREAANWQANIEAATKAASKKGLGRLLFWRHPKPAWHKMAGLRWQSPDGLVTFAVGQGKSQDMGLARDVASLNGRALFLPTGKIPGFRSATLVGTEVVAYKGDKKKGVYESKALVAVPTSLLPK